MHIVCNKGLQSTQADERAKNIFCEWSEKRLECQESDVSPGKTEVKQGKFVKFISPVKVYFRETYKSQNINPISPTPNFTLGIIQIKVKSLSTSFQWLAQ